MNNEHNSIVDLTNVAPDSIGEVLENAIAVLEGPKFMNRNRPYDGQPWTDTGVRGATQVAGLTFRDIRDCYIRAFIISHPYYHEGTLKRLEPNASLIDEANKGEKAQLNGNDTYFMVGSVDPIAVFQNLSCEMEKVMGIFPNLSTSQEETTKLLRNMGILGD